MRILTVNSLAELDYFTQTHGLSVLGREVGQDSGP